MTTRIQMIEAVKAAVAGRADVLAAWEGGSAAFGRDDGMSDIDVVLVVEDGAATAAFGVVEAALERLAPIALRYHVPEPAWHGHSQRFYRLEGASPFHMVDCVVIQASRPERFREVERHGAPAVWFDRVGAAAPQPFDRPAHEAKLRARHAVLADWFDLTQPLVEKEARRGRAVDALNFYHALTLRPVAEVLRMRYDPDRYDFGLRYLDRHLPAEVYARFAELAFVATLDELLAKLPAAAVFFHETHAAV